MKRRDFLFTATLASFATLYAGKIRAEETATLKLWAPPAMPAILMAVVAQRMRENHRQAALALYKGPEMLRAGLAGDTMPLLLTPTYVAANFYNRGKALRMLDIVSNGFFQLVANQKITRFEDLRGQKMVVVHKKNTLPDIVLHILLQAAKIEDQVEISYYKSLAETMEHIRRKECRIVMVAEPGASVMLEKIHGLGLSDWRQVLDLNAAWGRLLQTAPHIPMVGLVADQHFYAENTALIEEIRDETAKAAQWCRENPAQAAVYGQKVWPHASKEALTNAIPNSGLTCAGMDVAKEELLLYYRKVLALNPKLLGGKMPDAEFFAG